MSAFKVVFLGEGRVGKTSIGKRWAEDRFEQSQRSTVAAAFFQKSMNYEGKLLNIQLWDTAGQEEFHSLAPIYYKDAHAAILVFSCTDRKSFDRMMQWKNELTSSRGGDIKIVIVANKVDLIKDRCVSTEMGETFAKQVGANYFEVSAKTGENINLLFNHVASLLAKMEVSPTKKRGGSKGLLVINGEGDEEEVKKEKSGCCK